MVGMPRFFSIGSSYKKSAILGQFLIQKLGNPKVDPKMRFDPKISFDPKVRFDVDPKIRFDPKISLIPK